jgi:hypothetical protein
MPLSNAERADAHSNRVRLLLAWSLTLLLGVVAVTTSLGSGAVPSPPTGLSQVSRSFATALATGDSRLLDSLLHEEVEHRDLASGAAVRGRRAWEAFFREAYPTPTPSSGSTAEVLSSRLLTHNVAIANITLQHLAEPGHASSWPPHTAILFVFDRERWYVAATRAGGNYGTLAHGQLVD